MSGRGPTDVLLEVEGLKKHFPIREGLLLRTVDHVKAVDGVGFKVARGETIGIVGESGCGKTTLGRLILRLVEPTAGKVIFDGQDIVGLSEAEMRPFRKRMTIVFQDPYASLDPRMNIERLVGEPIRIHADRVDRAQLRDRVAALLQRVGLRPDALKRYPHELSGGQRQRVAIARTLILEPQLIVADEPVSALDVSVQAQVLNLLVELQQAFNLTYVFIGHDLRVVQYISDRVVVMYLGKVVESARVQTLFTHPRHPYTEALLESAPIADPKATRRVRVLAAGDVPSPIRPPEGCAFHPRCPRRGEGCDRVVPELREIEPGQCVRCHYPLPA